MDKTIQHMVCVLCLASSLRRMLLRIILGVIDFLLFFLLYRWASLFILLPFAIWASAVWAIIMPL